MAWNNNNNNEEPKQLAYHNAMQQNIDLMQGFGTALNQYISGDYKNSRIRYFSVFMIISPYLSDDQIEEFNKINEECLTNIRKLENIKKDNNPMGELTPISRQSIKKKFKYHKAVLGQSITKMDMKLRKYCKELGLLVPEKMDNSYFGN